MAAFEKFVFTIFVFGSWQLIVSNQSWTRCGKSTSHWKMLWGPYFSIETRDEVECISTCVRSVKCRAVGFNRLSLSCGHYDHYKFLIQVTNGAAHESVAFIRNISVIQINGTPGHYTYTFEAAKAACEAVGVSFMTEQKFLDRIESGFGICRCGWISEGRNVMPQHDSKPACYRGTVGLIPCPHGSSTADAWCTFP